mgnify:CR=1 FL=1
MLFDIDKMRAIRKSKGISQAKLADMTGIPLNTLAGWEQHRNRPKRINDLHNIAVVLDCYLDDFLADGRQLR